MENMAAKQEKNYIIHPQKFVLWLFIVTIILLFGALTSAYIVSKGIEGERGIWIPFSLPTIMWANSALIIMSSVTAQWSTWSARKQNWGNARIGYLLTLILGFFFILGQLSAWYRLVMDNVVFADTNSGSFMYVLTGAHGTHLIAGMIYLLIVWLKNPTKNDKERLLVSYENATTFWHFLSLLWVYLFIFLLINQT